MPRVKDCRIVIDLSQGEFQMSMGRKARDPDYEEHGDGGAA